MSISISQKLIISDTGELTPISRKSVVTDGSEYYLMYKDGKSLVSGNTPRHLSTDYELEVFDTEVEMNARITELGLE